jgi:hypothetical protein
MPKAPPKPAAAAKRVAPKAVAKATKPKVAIKPPAKDQGRNGERLSRIQRMASGTRVGTDEFGERVYTPLGETALEAFFHCLGKNGNVTLTCNELNLNRVAIYHMKKDETFLARFNAAMSMGVDSWEDEANRRAFEGYLRPVFQQGMKVGETREYSDNLAALILKGAKPERYNPVTKLDANLNMSGKIGVDHSLLTDEELDEKINTKLRYLGSLK